MPEIQSNLQTSGDSSQPRSASWLEVLWVFLRLGCTSFGGPVAHLGYFRKEFVERRRWCTESTYAELIAISQSLPGPGSSQVGFSIGLLRAGWLGGLAAWVGFTLPSALLMVALAFGHSLLSGPAGTRVFHGLQIVAVAVVAQALVTMQRSLAPDATRLLIAAVAMAMVLFVPLAAVNLVVIVIAAAAGLSIFRRRPAVGPSAETIALSRRSGTVAACAFLAMLGVALLVAVLPVAGLNVFSAFYRSGALVFGGGHVVLPILERAVVVPGWVTQPSFLAGYGAAQAMPGPLFSVAAYLGASVAPPNAPVLQRILPAMAGLAGIFLPGLLAMAAVLPFWSVLRQDARIRSALLGINASVVGILAAALVHPLWSSTIHTPIDFIVAASAFALLWVRGVQPWMVVLAVAALASFLF